VSVTGRRKLVILEFRGMGENAVGIGGVFNRGAETTAGYTRHTWTGRTGKVIGNGFSDRLPGSDDHACHCFKKKPLGTIDGLLGKIIKLGINDPI